MKSLLLLALMMTALATGATAGLPILTEQNEGREVILKQEKAFVVQLPANPTTGFSWSVTVAPSDLLVQEKPPQYLPSDHARKLVGSGGFQKWHFRFVKSGHAKLSFAYGRPWEKDVPPVRLLELKVTMARR
jgi:inhibitor of cysteine peptidase